MLSCSPGRSKYVFHIICTICATVTLFSYFQIDIYVLPKNVRKVDWVLRPLVAGFVALPTLSLSVSAGQ